MSSNWGYTLYGILAQFTDHTYIEKLHQQNSTPIHQFLEVLPNRTEAFWHICLLSDEAIYYVGEVIEKHDFFPAEHHQTNLQILEKSMSNPITETEFCQKYLVDDIADRRQTLQLLTPIGFKSQESYQIFPTVDLIIKSLWNHWQQFSTELSLEGEEVRNQIIDNTQILDYRLRSTRYSLKGNKIPSFSGNLVLKIHGPEPLVRLANLLLHFGEYSGLGMKTTLGMGGYRIKK